MIKPKRTDTPGLRAVTMIMFDTMIPLDTKKPTELETVEKEIERDSKQKQRTARGKE